MEQDIRDNTRLVSTIPGAAILLVSIGFIAAAHAGSDDSVRRLIDTNECVGCDLSYIDLRNADLQDANLARANLRGANLAGADLEGADLRGADLRHANLNNTNVNGIRCDNKTQPNTICER